MKKLFLVLSAVFVLSILNVAANKTSVEVSVPDSAKAGEEITIVIGRVSVEIDRCGKRRHRI